MGGFHKMAKAAQIDTGACHLGKRRFEEIMKNQ